MKEIYDKEVSINDEVNFNVIIKQVAIQCKDDIATYLVLN